MTLVGLTRRRSVQKNNTRKKRTPAVSHEETSPERCNNHDHCAREKITQEKFGAVALVELKPDEWAEPAAECAPTSPTSDA